MFGMKIVVQENRVLGARAQQLLSFRNVFRDVDEVSLEARRKPAVASFIIIQ